MDHLLRATSLAEAHHFWFNGFRSFVTPLLREATRGVAHPVLLDCGCGTGANLELLGRHGRAFGFDLSPTGLQIGQQLGRTRLARATVAAVPFPSNAFDVVTSFDVLYSLEEPIERAAVAEMYRLLRPGGYALVNVAAMEVLRGDHSVLSREVRRYSRATARPAARPAPDSGSFASPTRTRRCFCRCWRSGRPSGSRGLSPEDHAQKDITVPPAPVNALLTAVLRVESWWLRSFDCPFGSSLLCLARKPA